MVDVLDKVLTVVGGAIMCGVGAALFVAGGAGPVLGGVLLFVGGLMVQVAVIALGVAWGTRRRPS